MFELVYQNQLKTSLHFIHRAAAEIETAQNIFPFPTKTPSNSARWLSLTARRNVPPFLLQNAFSKKSQVQRTWTPSLTPKNLSPKGV